MRIAPPHRSAVSAPCQVPEIAKPIAAGTASEMRSHAQKSFEIRFMPRSVSMSGTYFVSSARPSATKSQPTCAWKRFFAAAMKPLPPPVCGLCGSPSTSEN